MDKDFEPKLVSVLKEGYSWNIFGKDLLAGIIVGIVALPLSIAIAIASGVKPEQGLLTAVVAGFLIALLSGSRVQIGGPTGAFIVVVYGIVQKYGYDGLAIATVMAGIFLIVLGLAKMGNMIKFIPYPITVGFTAGIAVIIFTSQIRDFLGLTILDLPDHFIPKWISYLNHFSTLNGGAVFLGILTILIVSFWPKVTKRVPGPLIAIIGTTVLAEIFHLPVETIASRFGEVPNIFPAPHLPVITWDKLVALSSPALTIALLAGVESLLSAVVADGMTQRKHRSNMELIAQGVANIVSPLFGGIPATGAIARTATNIKNGGLTPFAGMIHAVVVLVLFLFFGHLAGRIPLATLAGILIVVAYNMSEWHLFGKLLRNRRGDVLILLVTFFLTVLVDLTVAIEVGVVLAAFLFMHRVVELTAVDYVNEDYEEEQGLQNSASKRKIPPGVEIFEINGPFFFGAADKFRDTIRQVGRNPKVLILGMRHVPSIDSSGLRALEDLCEQSKRSKTKVLIFGVSLRLHELFEKTGFVQAIGSDSFFPSIDACLAESEKYCPPQNRQAK